MIELLKNLNFLLKLFWVLDLLFWDGFDGAFLLGLDVFGHTDNSKCTATKSFLGDLVVLFNWLVVFDDEGGLFDKEILNDGLHKCVIFLKINFGL